MSESGSPTSSPLPFLVTSNPLPHLTDIALEHQQAPVGSSSTEAIGLPMHLDPASPEMLMLRFDKRTCGILSMKDGPTDNPWRTLIWPSARELPALYHAILALTAFHGSHEAPDLYLVGVAHVGKSLGKLATHIQNMQLDDVLATSLVLAQVDRWDKMGHESVHLSGAWHLVDIAIKHHRRTIQAGQVATGDRKRLEFLCNLYVYTDVITRLTSLKGKEVDYEGILALVKQPQSDLVEVDPSMGCATSLFPLMGRTAALIQSVRNTRRNTLIIISQAQQLKQQLEEWSGPLDPNVFELAEDPYCQVLHSIQTAEAFRYAMLLYLHQAVPEIPSKPSIALARKVVGLLATVPQSSRTSIGQIFPLLAGGCELTEAEDREWLSKRWTAIFRFLQTHVAPSCWDVIRETWRRRDQYEARKETNRGQWPLTPLEQPEYSFEELEPAYTVRGRLHWVVVMEELGLKGKSAPWFQLPVPSLISLLRIVFLG